MYLVLYYLVFYVNSILLFVFVCHLLFSLYFILVRSIHIDTFHFSLLVFITPFYVITTNYLSFIDVRHLDSSPVLLLQTMVGTFL